MMLTVTAATAVMAWTQDAEILAAFAMVGGFATPLLLSTGQNRELALFSYVAILDLGALTPGDRSSRWRRAAGSELCRNDWRCTSAGTREFLRFAPSSALTVGFATMFFAIFALAPAGDTSRATEA